MRGVWWWLIWPIRMYIRYAPWKRGKAFLRRTFIIPFLPPGEKELEVLLPSGGKILLRHGETLGLSSLLYGVFERHELEFLIKSIPSGSYVIDVGANVGLLTVSLAMAVGNKGRILAIEPLPENVERLRANVERNGLSNVDIIPVLLGETEGLGRLQLADDGAYPSIVKVVGEHATGRALEVEMLTLDSIWNLRGRPSVAAMKIDVEGAEPLVLSGAMTLLKACHPLLLIEANSEAQLDLLVRLLGPLGYRVSQPRGFESWNYVFDMAGIITVTNAQ